jgi:hypothetical protein
LHFLAYTQKLRNDAILSYACGLKLQLLVFDCRLERAPTKTTAREILFTALANWGLAMNIGVQVSSIESALPVPQFKIGDFVRIKGGSETGRVLQDTDDGGYTRVHVFDTGNRWGQDGNARFHGCLEMWTPLAAVDDQFRERMEIDRLHRLAARHLGSFELIVELIEFGTNKDPTANHENLLDNVKLIAEMSADAACETVEMLWDMLKKQPDIEILRDKILADCDLDFNFEPEPDSDED